MHRCNQKGFSVVEGLLVVAVIAVIGFGGYFVWSRNNEKTSVDENSSATQDNSASTNTTTEENIDAAEKNKNSAEKDSFSIELPSGWSENKNATAPIGSPETYHEFVSTDGKKIGVSINSDGFGGGGDGEATFAIVNNKIVLTESFKPCDGEQDLTGGCKYGDGSLELLASSSEAVSGDQYLLWLWDENSEDQAAYTELKAIIETIVLK